MASTKGMTIRQLTLFNNGYGVFERAATVAGNGSIDLYFVDREMQDVLQSLCFVGGSNDVGNISYESTKQQPSIVLDDREPLLSLFKSLTGCQVALVVKGDGEKSCVEELEGQILGVDSELYEANSHYFVSMLLKNDMEIKTVAMADIKSTKLLERRTKDDVLHAMDHAQTEKNPNLQKLTIFYKDALTEKPLTVKYGLHIAEWKSSYRLVFVDDTGAFRLDGFAIVKNTQEEDWSDIGLTLVVGNPKLAGGAISGGGKAGGKGVGIQLEIKPIGQGRGFSVTIHPADSVFDLKKAIQRENGVAVHEQRLIFAGKEITDGRSLADYNLSAGSCLRLDRRTAGRAAASSEYDSMMMKRKFIMAQQDGLSYYPIQMPVSAKRKQTAIVPLMQAELQGQLVTIYDDSIKKGNPLAAVLFENTTGRTLEQGTLQVMTEERFLGEGSLPGLGKGDESAPIPYAVEMGVEVSMSHTHKQHHAHEIKIRDGSIFLNYYRQQTTKYIIKNQTQRQLDFMLNHVFLDGWELYDHEDEGIQPVDITDRVYQFRFDVPPCSMKDGSAQPAEVVFPVREQVVSVNTVPIDTLSTEFLRKMEQRGTIPKKDPVFAALEETIRIQQGYNTIMRMISEKESELRDCKDTQSRLQKLILAVGAVEASKNKRYLNSLSTEEDRLNNVDSEIKSLRNDKQAEKRKHQSKIAKIKFHRKDIPAPPTDAVDAEDSD